MQLSNKNPEFRNFFESSRVGIHIYKGISTYVD